MTRCYDSYERLLSSFSLLFLLQLFVSLARWRLYMYLFVPRGFLVRSSEDFDNETYGIINSISKMEDFWRQFDIKDLQCQKRALCEINHNESLLSSIPTKFLTTFRYYISFAFSNYQLYI